ncbi:zinc finger protein 658-like isoform X3 [Pteropus vampyrus]|uniref:Zinc finger protein 658-like isoform X3 n=1 Tax=Pteropus vampyrus TaxID=132908 RepID=A0A6P6C614_PTEVA|nr:zinc finger protein 658-like isoform X3 [Pteropus vampyrus]
MIVEEKFFILDTFWEPKNIGPKMNDFGVEPNSNTVLFTHTVEPLQFLTFFQEQQKMNIAQFDYHVPRCGSLTPSLCFLKVIEFLGSVSFEDVTVEFTPGYCITKPQVIFKLEQGEEPWSLEEEFPNQRCPGYYKVDVHIEGNQEKQEKPLRQIIFIDNKTLNKEGQKVLGKRINLDSIPDFSGKMPCKCDSCRTSSPFVSELIISDRNCSRKKANYMNVCEKLQFVINHEKTHTGERSYKYNKNVKAFSLRQDHQKIQTLEQSSECSEFGKVSHDETVVCVTAQSFLIGEESCQDCEFKKNCDKATLFNHARTGTKEKCFDLNECSRSCDKTTTAKYNQVHMVMMHYECNKNENNFSKNSPLTQPQRAAPGQAFARSKCEENLSQSSAQKTPTGDMYCVFNGCTNAFFQELDLRVYQRTQTEEKFCKFDKYGEFWHQISPLSVHQESTTGEES